MPLPFLHLGSIGPSNFENFPLSDRFHTADKPDKFPGQCHALRFILLRDPEHRTSPGLFARSCFVKSFAVRIKRRDLI